MTKPSSLIKLRLASKDDLLLLQFWDTKQHIIASIPDGSWNWKEELSQNPSWREQYIAELKGVPLGFIQIINAHKEETHYWGNIAPHTKAIDIWIGEECNLNKGYGTIMMKMAIDRCFSDPKTHQILIDPLKSNTKAHRFYERLGFEFVEERKFDGEDCFVYSLTRPLLTKH